MWFKRKKKAKWPVQVDEPNAFTPQDSTQLRFFLDTPAGANLLKWLYYGTFCEAFATTCRTDFEQGIQVGRIQTIQQLRSMAVPPAADDADTEAR